MYGIALFAKYSEISEGCNMKNFTVLCKISYAAFTTCSELIFRNRMQLYLVWKKNPSKRAMWTKLMTKMENKFWLPSLPNAWSSSSKQYFYPQPESEKSVIIVIMRTIECIILGDMWRINMITSWGWAVPSSS